jgi:hypothetical protein
MSVMKGRKCSEVRGAEFSAWKSRGVRSDVVQCKKKKLKRVGCLVL